MHSRNSWKFNRKTIAYLLFYGSSVGMVLLLFQAYEWLQFMQFEKRIHEYSQDGKVHEFFVELYGEDHLQMPFALHFLFEGGANRIGYKVVTSNEEGTYQYISLLEVGDYLGTTETLSETHTETMDINHVVKTLIQSSRFQIVNPLWEKKAKVFIDFDIKGQGIQLCITEISSDFSHFNE